MNATSLPCMCSNSNCDNETTVTFLKKKICEVFIHQMAWSLRDTKGIHELSRFKADPDLLRSEIADFLSDIIKTDISPISFAINTEKAVVIDSKYILCSLYEILGYNVSLKDNEYF